MKSSTYKDLIVWQKSISLVEEVYIFTRLLPKDEVYGLISQMRRAAVSIASNIAEGKMRGSAKEFKHFLLNAYSSGAELETQVEISKRLYKSCRDGSVVVETLLVEVMKMLNVLISTISFRS